MDDVIETTPDKERAKSLLEKVEVRLDSVDLMKNSDPTKFASMIIEHNYEAILELITTIMSLDGYKIRSESTGIHISSINYMRKYKELGEHEIRLIDDLRKKRIGSKYYGRHIDSQYMESRENEVKSIIDKLKSIAKKKI
ncbi:MAG: hypothetical protein ABIH52_03480 [Candidatus Aenigmatarchaeota archaeon]|nr:hypothetical protein [Nanoarchaeota archaeon]